MTQLQVEEVYSFGFLRFYSGKTTLWIELVIVFIPLNHFVRVISMASSFGKLVFYKIIQSYHSCCATSRECGRLRSLGELARLWYGPLVCVGWHAEH